MKKNLAVIVLAAGYGKRMKSDLPKALHELCGRPILNYVLDLASQLKPKKIVAVLGHKQELVRKILPQGVEVAIQKKLNGTAGAVSVGMSKLGGFNGTVLILCTDMPLLTKAAIDKLIAFHNANLPAATVLFAQVKDSTGYGRILRDKYFSVSGIIEEKDANEYQKNIKEINTGIYCFNKAQLSSALKKTKADNANREHYLTDCIGILYKSGALVEGVALADADQALGINSRLDLAKANAIMQKRINRKLMESGVTIIDPASAFINYATEIGQDTVIYPFTVVEKNVKIGKRCQIGPFIHLREGTRLEDEVIAGNFLEVTRSKLGSKTIIKHFAYLGDAVVGRNANIGAGTVTANFDCGKKYSTSIGDNAFIGSDTVLVAPAKIGKHAKTGAGTVVLKNKKVPDGAVVVGVPARILKR